jgi:cysteine-rich repeat protein
MFKKRLVIGFFLGFIVVNWAIAAPLEHSNMATSSFSTHKAVDYSMPICGNSLLELGEQCDDGDRNHYNLCNNSCEVNAGYPQDLSAFRIDKSALKSAAPQIANESKIHIGRWTFSALLILLIIAGNLFWGYLKWPRFIKWRIQKKD